MSLMQIPRKIEYALRAMIHLADHPEGVARGTEIARDEQIPKYYLEKVIRDLMHRGLAPGANALRANPARSRRGQGSRGRRQGLSGIPRRVPFVLLPTPTGPS